MKKILFIITLLFTSMLFSQDITGKWYGKLSIMGSELLFELNFDKKETLYTGTIDIPQQNAIGIPLSSVTFEDKTLVFKFDQAKFSYSGKFNDALEFDGIFSQNGQNFPLKLTRTKTAVKKINRPQEPKAPFPYEIDDVVFENVKANVSLAGTFTYPKKENYPTVVLISGSGQQDRNSEIFGHKPFWVIADYLTRNGIGVLRIDDRGVGQSGGDPTTSTSYDFATDIEASVAYLKNRKGVNAKKIGLIGHSEGGMIAPIVASKDKSISFIVLLAGPGIPGDELLLEQTYLIGKSSGMNETALEEIKKFNKSVYTIVKSNKTDIEAQKELETVFNTMYSDNSEFNNLNENDRKEALNQQIEPLLSPWFRNFISYEPAVFLQKVKCPVLVLNGEKDLQVPPKTNMTGIKNSLEKGGNKKVTVKEYPNLNHLFQESETGSVDEYGTIEQTFSPIVLTDIKDWILLQAK
jgi:uncharacterized protein